jgi:protein-tyrosine-phosphatase
LTDGPAESICRIMFVCFGNICRSPMAEGLAAKLAEQEHRDQASLVEFSSAGIGAQNGNPPTPEAVQAMARRGIDIAAHRARRATPDVVEAAGLVLTMEERQRQWLLDSGAAPATFSLRRLSEAAHLALRQDGVALSAGTVRERRDHLGDLVEEIEREGLWSMADHEYDVPDPIGLTVGGYITVSGRIEEAVRDILRALLP